MDLFIKKQNNILKHVFIFMAILAKLTLGKI
jgi:hypothetical protein